MTWQILNVEPPYAICDQCKRHDCGIVDGEHKWVRTGIYDRYDNPIIIGYKCVAAWAENLGISHTTVTHETVRPPTTEEIGEAVVNWCHFKWGETHGNDTNPPAPATDNPAHPVRQQTGSRAPGEKSTRRRTK